jgi:uncharacterized cupredoxin-like copper-binding protein
MRFGKMIATAGGAAVLAGMVALSGPAAWAQDATPEAVEAMPPRPAHIHTGTCNEVGEVIAPLTDLTGATGGDRVGQARRAIPAESSFTSVPMTLDAILGSDHVVNVHLSAEEIDTYIACGEIGGMLTPEGAVIIGLGEMDNSGFTGIAYLAPGADGASTDVSVFVAQTQGGRNRERGAEGTPAVGGEEAVATEVTTAETPETVPAETPATTDVTGTPVAEVADEATMAGEQIPVSLVEFAIDMPDTLPAGPVTFMVTNNGTVTHSFEIESADLEEELESELAPGETGMLTVDLAPGTYEVYCPVDGHRQQGMELEVTAA